MKAKVLIAALIAISFAACKKDKFTTKPQLEFKEVSPTVLQPNQSIIFTLHYTDREGDIQDSLFVQKVTQNCENSNFQQLYPIPSDVPKQSNAEGDIQVRYSYGIGLGYPPIKEPACISQDDTCVFRFVLKDVEGNTSDTISSSQIILIKR